MRKLLLAGFAAVLFAGPALAGGSTAASSGAGASASTSTSGVYAQGSATAGTTTTANANRYSASTTTTSNAATTGKSLFGRSNNWASTGGHSSAWVR